MVTKTPISAQRYTWKRHSGAPLQVLCDKSPSNQADKAPFDEHCPVSRLVCPPDGIVFCSSTNSAIAATQARFISPPTNSNAINSQQQPRQKKPCRIPVTTAPSAP